MANPKAASKSESKPNAAPKPVEPPSGWRKLDSRVAGFWAEKHGPICGTLQGARMFINRNDRETTVYIIKLAKPCMASVQLEGGGLEVIELQAGELCGVFGSAGLSALLEKGGARVWINRDGERKTKRGVMKVYDVRSPDEGSRVKIEHWTPDKPRGEEPPDGASDIDEVPF